MTEKLTPNNNCFKIPNSLQCLLPRCLALRILHVSLLPATLEPPKERRSQVGRWAVSNTRTAAWRLQKMTASRCTNRRIRLFGLCTTADGEINTGWTSYGRFVWFPQCCVYISLGFLLQSWPPRDPRSSVHSGQAVTCLPFFSCLGGGGGHSCAAEGAAFVVYHPPFPSFMPAVCPDLDP